MNQQTKLFSTISFFIFLLFSLTAEAGGIKLKYTPSDDPDLAPGESITVTLYDDKDTCTGGTYSYWFDTPSVGTATLSGDQLTYTNDGTNGYLSSNKDLDKFKLYISCDITGDEDDKWLKPKDSIAGTGGGGSSSTGSSCNCSGGSGTVILDNTSNPNAPAIGANLFFIQGGSKSSTAISNGIGGNAINITDFQTITRDNTLDPHHLNLYIGDDPTIVDDNNFGTSNQLDFFASGKHLFELSRLRTTADWLSEDLNGDNIPDNITPTVGTPFGSYGTISMSQFLQNISLGQTMYGVVRVKIGLELLSSATGTALNALGQTVNANTIYNFCSSNTGLCSCAPGSSFGKIQASTAICGYSLPANAKIKVKGALLWDFVDNLTGDPVPLDNLPFAPRDLYFKVEVPIMVNWAHDVDDDGAMDNMPYIQSLTQGMTGTNPMDITTTIGPIDFNKIPQISKDEYQYYTGNVLDATSFAALNVPNQYHLLMPSGYADGWADAFNTLNISAATWATLPPDSCVKEAGGACNKYSVPSSVTGIMSANDVRSEAFEDIPTYLYSGGLIDMHSHTNINGLIYVPQGLELEAKDSSAPTQQYLIGAVVVRDSFYIEAKNNTITVISSDPASYSTARVSNYSSGGSQITFSTLTPGAGTSTTTSGSGGSGGAGESTSGGGCLGCSSATTSGSGGSSNSPANTQWIEIRPQI